MSQLGVDGSGAALPDESGNPTITGRTKDLIKSGGEWINPREVEDIIGGLPQVGLAAVVGRPHAKWGERPVLFVEPRRDHTIDRQTLLDALQGKVPERDRATPRVARYPLQAARRPS